MPSHLLWNRAEIWPQKLLLAGFTLAVALVAEVSYTSWQVTGASASRAAASGEAGASSIASSVVSSTLTNDGKREGGPSAAAAELGVELNDKWRMALLNESVRLTGVSRLAELSP